MKRLSLFSWFRACRSLGCLLPALVIGSAGIAATPSDSAKPVRLLTIGNSFAVDVSYYLPKLAEHGGKKLVLLGANISGAPLEKHVRSLEAFEARPDDPEGRPYTGKLPGATASGRFSLREALVSQPWDIITIQQASQLSYEPDSFEPWAGKLIAYVKAHAPGAEIVIHQTWAYREDHPFFADGTLNQATMYARLRATYAELAVRYKLRIIPVGDAFQLARAMPQWKFSGRDTQFNYKNPRFGALPVETGALNEGWHWNRKEQLLLDAKHANVAGRYLGASVFFEFLFHEPVGPDGFVPPGISADEAASLRAAAHAAVSGLTATDPRAK